MGDRAPKKYSVVQRFGALFLAALLTFTLCASTADARETPKIVRVGYPVQEGLTEVDDQGKLSGYSYEYLQEIAQYTGWEYEFVQLEGDSNEVLSQMLDMLEQGELDILTSLVYNDALAEIYDYPGRSYGTSYSVLRVLEDNARFSEGSLHTVAPLRIAVPTTTKRLETLDQYCQINGITYEIVRCDTAALDASLLRRGEADAILGLDLSPMEGTRIVAKFAPQPFYFATTKGNREVVSGLNSAILRIEDADPYFSAGLYEKYFGAAAPALVLNDSEQAYIREHPALKVAINSNKSPFQYVDTKTGQVRGIAVDLLSYVSEQTGLTFEYVFVDGSPGLTQALTQNQVDLAAAILYDYASAQKNNVALTRAYAVGYNVLVLNNGADPASLSSLRQAVPSGNVLTDQEEATVLRYPSIEDCIAAVNKGEADYCYGNSFAVQYYVNRARYANISMVPQSQQPSKVGFGIAKPADPSLLSIFNKVLRSIPDSDLQAIIYRNTINVDPITLFSFLASNPLITFAIGFGLLLVVILILLLILRTRNRLNRLIALDNQKYQQLGALTNEYVFEYDYHLDRLTFSGKDAQKYLGTSQILEHYGSHLKALYGDVSDTLYAQLATGQDCNLEVFMHFTQGQRAWARVITKIVTDAKGAPLYAIGKLMDIQEDMEERERLLYQAQRDSLTGIYNAATCRKLITQHLQSGAVAQHSALLLMDIDHFKDINDRLGHLTGDRALVALSAALTASFQQEDDLVGRVGGDEFIVYLADVVSPQALAEKCTALQAQMRRCISQRPEDAVTLSIGVALVHAGGNYDSLYEQADQLLYTVKNRGRDGYEIGEL